MNWLDEFPIKFTCSECHGEGTKLVRDVKANGHVACPHCGHTAQLDEAGRKLLAAAEEEISRFSRSLK